MKDFVIDNILIVVKEDKDHSPSDRLFVEECGSYVKDLEGYLVFVENEDKLNMALEEISKRQEKYRDTFNKMVQCANNGVGSLLNYMLLGESASWTEALCEKFGGFDKVLEYYGLTPLEEASIDELEGEDYIEDDLPEVDSLDEIKDIENVTLGEDIGMLVEEDEPIDEPEKEPEKEIEKKEEVPTKIEEVLVEEPAEIIEEIEPKEDIEKHVSESDISYNNMKDKEDMKQQVVNEVLAKVETSFTCMNSNIEKLVDIMSKLAETQGVSKEDITQIEEEFDDTPVTRDEMVEGLDYIKDKVGKVDETILNRFVSMYDQGNEKLVTELLTDVMEFIYKGDK